MKRKHWTRDIEDMDVEIKWADPVHDWPNFRVLRVWPKRRIMELVGIGMCDGTPHEGDKFLVRYKEIEKLEVML